jgi:tRNA modification GTPase
MLSGDTIFALSSGRPPAAVAIIRTSGPQAFVACEMIAGRLPAARQPALITLRMPISGEEIDQALVLRFDGPKSVTGENVVEYQCHGSRAVIDALLGVLTSLSGMREAEPGEFTRRAFANGRIDLTEAEGLADLLEAETESQRRAALLMAEGGLRKQIEAWRQTLVDLSARAEAAIDYVGDEEETAADEHMLGWEAQELAAELTLWLARPRAEPLREGVRVVVAGPPNSGKSSLVNALAEAEKAIVTDVAGTTRDAIEVPLAIAGIPIILVDTAGLRESTDIVEAIGIDRAEGQMRRADLILWLGEPESAPDSQNVIRVHGRADLPGRCSVPEGSSPVSSVAGTGLTTLVQRIVAQAKVMLPIQGELALNRRQAWEIELARDALAEASCTDLVRLAEGLRSARAAFDRLSGRSGVEDVLDVLFGRFCLGK